MNLPRNYQSEVLQDRFALRIAARLSDGAQELPHDIGERLRHARMQALARRKTAPAVAAATTFSGPQLALFGGDRDGPLWLRRLGAVLALVMLIGALRLIGVVQDDIAAGEIAQVDAALLTDDLPPSAYSDPGFAQFLKLGRPQGQ